MSKRSGIMLCYPLEEKRLLNQIRGCQWSWPVLVQPKLDGERCRANDGTSLISSELNSFNHTVPHILKAYQKLCLKISFCPELDGELYCHGLTFEEIHSRVSTSRITAHKDYLRIKFQVFDLVDLKLNQKQRLNFLDYLKLDNPLVLVPTYVAHNLNHIKDYLEKFSDNGYEGIIVRESTNLYVRKRSNHILKFKPKKIDVYKIIDVQEEVTLSGLPKDTLGSLICEKDDQSFSTGTGTFTNEQKKKIWSQRNNLIGMYCKIWYQNITSEKKVPRFVSKIKILKNDPEQNPSSNINPLLNIGN